MVGRTNAAVGAGGKKVKIGTIIGNNSKAIGISVDFVPSNFIIAQDVPRASTGPYSIVICWQIGEVNSGWGYETGGSNQHKGLDCSGSYSGGIYTIFANTSGGTGTFMSSQTYYYMLAE